MMFWLITWIVGAFFVAAEVMFLWLMFRFKKRSGVPAQYVTGKEKHLKRWITVSHQLILVFDIIIIIEGALFRGLVVRTGGSGRRTFMTRRRDKLRLTGGPPLMPRLRKLSVLDQQKVVFADVIAARLIGCIYGFSRNGIEQFLFEAMARAPVNPPKGDPLRRRDCGIERDRTRHEGQL